jgi:hypothetical protein
MYSFMAVSSDEEKDDEQTGERDEPIDEFCV